MFVNYAHRGASSYAPENTMSSFRKALEIGSNGIELDLQQTKDGKIVVFHDDTIDKKSNGTGKICDYTCSELLELDFGSWFNESFKGERIVLFEDFAEQFLSRDIIFAIELKDTGFEQKALDIMKKYSNMENIYISSFSYEALENIRKIDRCVKISWLIKEHINEQNLSKLKKIGGSQICPSAENVSAEEIETAKAAGFGVRLWGVTDEETMKKVFSLDVDGMTVNFPDKLKILMAKD